MTIYAIVNNLLSSSDGKDSSLPVWTLISPAGILQGGNPYFVPDFAGRFEARLALAVRVGKLGKGIAPRFVDRYVDSVAPCVIFIATDLLQSLRRQGLPWTSALSYDKCLAIGKFFPISIEDISKCEIKLSLDSHEQHIESCWNSDTLHPDIKETLAALSRDNTLKTGDVILLGIDASGPEVKPDMRATLGLNGINSLAFNIR